MPDDRISFESTGPSTSPFDAIRHTDGEREFWLARELSKILGYGRWENFENVIAKAKIACKFNGHDVDL
jgi:DNA-damage-inducible protein D